MRKRAAQYGKFLSQFEAQLFGNRSGSPDPLRVKRLPTRETSQNPRFSAKPIVGIGADMREATSYFTAIIRQGEL